MENSSLLVMVGGTSSRMKKSLQSSSKGLQGRANLVHKSLISVGVDPKPFLFYLVRNAFNAGYSKLYLITGEENQAFKDLENEGCFPKGMQVFYAIQHIPKEREKPLGTADALQQCLEQFPELREETFTICNGDNLYSEGALRDLRTIRTAPNALISYASSGLEFGAERIVKFAIMNISEDNFLKEIVEKPDMKDINRYRDESGELRVSMNIFSFSGELIFPFLKACPLDKTRNEKELPRAVSNMVKTHPKSMWCIPRSEHIPDLTEAADIALFKNLQ